MNLSKESDAVPRYGHPYITHAICPFHYPITKEYLTQMSMVAAKPENRSAQEIHRQQNNQEDNPQSGPSQIHPVGEVYLRGDGMGY